MHEARRQQRWLCCARAVFQLAQPDGQGLPARLQTWPSSGFHQWYLFDPERDLVAEKVFVVDFSHFMGSGKERERLPRLDGALHRDPELPRGGGRGLRIVLTSTGARGQETGLYRRNNSRKL